MIFPKRAPRPDRPARVRRSAPFPVSDHSDGRRFHNVSGSAGKHRVLAFFRWTATRHLQLRKGRRASAIAVEPASRATEPDERLPIPLPRLEGAPQDRNTATGAAAPGSLLVTWVGHSTLLVQMDGVNLLTDPIWSERCSPLAFAGPRRRNPPGLVLEELPRIDLVIVSHNHYDHLDLPTVRKLAERHDPLFVVPLGVAAWFRRRKLHRVVELDWWQSTEHAGLTVHATPAQHFSGRSPWDANKTLWVSFVVEGAAGRFFFGGDTGYGPHFAEIGRRLGPMRLAAIPIGAYSPRWFMAPVHIDPEQAVQAHLDLCSRQSIGIHFGTFKLTDEPMEEPPVLLRECLDVRGIDRDLFWVPVLGRTWAVPKRIAPERELAEPVLALATAK
ncbi:MAG: MBL fold metallo-hydrolase [Candidatus Wallbacteria bacterium]|nr:MBL fold metallo-hydrolase [Candidatus Wallbacteria bacterium]